MRADPRRPSSPRAPSSGASSTASRVVLLIHREHHQRRLAAEGQGRPRRGRAADRRPRDRRRDRLPRRPRRTARHRRVPAARRPRQGRALLGRRGDRRGRRARRSVHAERRGRSHRVGPLDKARAQLTYARDAECSTASPTASPTGQPAPSPIVALRHGKATSRLEWHGPDATRPLLPRAASRRRRSHPDRRLGPRRSQQHRRPVPGHARAAVRALRRRRQETDAISQDAFDRARTTSPASSRSG